MLTGDVDLVIRAAQGAAPCPVPLHLLPLKRLPIPLPEFRGRFIGFLKKAQEELVRVGRLTNRLVRQDELPKALVVEGLRRAQRRVAKASSSG